MSNLKRVNDFNDTVLAYYKSLSKFKPFDKDKERELIRRVQENGDSAARNELIKANLKFVFDMAKSYAGKGVSISDLISEGNMALMTAIAKFDLNNDVKLISYAVVWIKHAMAKSIVEANKKGMVEVQDENVFNTSVGCEDEDKLTVVDVSFGSSREMDKMIDDSHYSDSAMRVMSVLSNREKKVISMFYGLEGNENENFVEIGKQLGISGERARQVKNQAMRKMRAHALEAKITI